MSDEKLLFAEDFDEKIDFGDLDEEKNENTDASGKEASEIIFEVHEQSEASEKNDKEETASEDCKDSEDDLPYEINIDEVNSERLTDTEEDLDSEEASEDENDSESDIYDEDEDENDTVAMVSRNSERVQTNRTPAPVISGEEKEFVFEQPVSRTYVNVQPAPAQQRNVNIQPAVQKKPEPRQNNRSSVLVISNIVISAVTLCAVAIGSFSAMGKISDLEKRLQEKTTELEELKSSEKEEEEYKEAVLITEEAPETPEEFIETEKEKILLWDSVVGYSWTPVLSGLKQHNFAQENFSINNRGHMEYVVDGDTASYFGIDVSSYQGDIDWNAVREDGVEFAILRVGYRGYGEEGKIRMDEKFLQNYDGANEAGIDVGVYFFSQATSVDEAIEEAKFVLDCLGDRRLEYPVVYDWETVVPLDENDVPRTEDVMPNTLTLSAIAFCETIQSEGYDAMIYTNKKQATIKYDMRQLANYPVWLALYDTELTYCYDFDIWQYGTGLIDGIEGEVDFNIGMIK